jgi:S-DNA-T family DNA segregation ATPase FtsK/SpoIIIE
LSKLKDKAVESSWATHLRRGLFEALVIGLLILSGFLLLSELTYYPKDPGWSYMGEVSVVRNGAGRAGAFCADMLFMLFGYLAYLFPLLIA